MIKVLRSINKIKNKFRWSLTAKGIKLKQTQVSENCIIGKKTYKVILNKSIIKPVE